jgi:Fe-S-cluster containining protein
MKDPDSDLLKGTIALRIDEQTAILQARLPRGDVPVGAIVPLARDLTEAVVTWAVSDAEAAGQRISCRAGCGACCRQAVPIGHAEARRLSALVDEMPEPRRSVVQARFKEATARLRQTELLQRQEALSASDRADRQQRSVDWAMEYFHLKLACPFLEGESCSIHPERPLICREYLVTTPASECAAPSRETVQRVPIKTRVSKAMLELGKEGGPSSWMPLVMALEWTAAHPTQTVRRPALDWVRSLQKLLERKSETDSQPGSEPEIAPSD